MSHPSQDTDGRPTRVRYLLLTVATANAFLLYLDRICMGAVVQATSFQQEMGLNKEQTGDVLASFFFAYALGQTPAGWLADRFGPRRMLTCYILLWSLCTAATGFATGLWSLLAARIACGLAEAGAYPASGLLITRWFPFLHRARANGVVAFGGRVGNSLALWLTASAIARFGSWRPVLWIYGAFGVLLAAATYTVFRDHPDSHPWSNEAERRLIRLGSPAESRPRLGSPWKSLFRHRGLWFFNLGAVGLNIGWAFLITWLPAYLVEVRHLDRVTASRYVSIALAFSLSGMLLGGWWCDVLTRRYGQRWGRRLPFLLGSAVCIAAYLLCPWLKDPVLVAVACGVVAFASDSLGPAVWAVGQDIGGRHVAATMAWSNMWGNFGASAVAKIIPMVLASPLHYADWREVFWLCAGGFALLGLCALLVDATRSIETVTPAESL
ncbi:MAG: MFS transporter [Bryobacteraceae bacterium]|nr:MFS transporter [Bryobacteraceae bacterium]MDW8377190.1 MFS transporter [Bryobacterales bacterium]